MTEAECRQLLRIFLRQHPEHAAGVKDHPRLGPVMEAAALDAFLQWSADRGLGDAEKIAHFRNWFAGFNHRN
jgi:hypothetical protein